MYILLYSVLQQLRNNPIENKYESRGGLMLFGRSVGVIVKEMR